MLSPRNLSKWDIMFGSERYLLSGAQDENKGIIYMLVTVERDDIPLGPKGLEEESSHSICKESPAEWTASRGALSCGRQTQPCGEDMAGRSREMSNLTSLSSLSSFCRGHSWANHDSNSQLFPFKLFIALVSPLSHFVPLSVPLDEQ